MSYGGQAGDEVGLYCMSVGWVVGNCRVKTQETPVNTLSLCLYLYINVNINIFYMMHDTNSSILLFCSYCISQIFPDFDSIFGFSLSLTHIYKFINSFICLFIYFCSNNILLYQQYIHCTSICFSLGSIHKVKNTQPRKDVLGWLIL